MTLSATRWLSSARDGSVCLLSEENIPQEVAVLHIWPQSRVAISHCSASSSLSSNSTDGGGGNNVRHRLSSFSDARNASKTNTKALGAARQIEIKSEKSNEICYKSVES